MHIVVAPGRLKDGVTEATMLAASERFQNDFVRHQSGILQRHLVAGADGTYADIVMFADEAAIGDVMAAEQTNPVCHEFMALWDDPQVAVYRVLQANGTQPR